MSPAEVSSEKHKNSTGDKGGERLAREIALATRGRTEGFRMTKALCEKKIETSGARKKDEQKNRRGARRGRNEYPWERNSRKNCGKDKPKQKVECNKIEGKA